MNSENDQFRQHIEALIYQVQFLSQQMKLLAAEQAYEQLNIHIQERQLLLEDIFKDYMAYLTDEDIQQIANILVIDQEIEHLVASYQHKVHAAFEKQKKSFLAHKSYRDQK